MAATYGSSGSDRSRDSERGVPGHQVSHTTEVTDKMVFCIINDIKMGLLNLPPLCLCSSGLNTLYQGEAELNKLLKLVLTEGDYKKH